MAAFEGVFKGENWWNRGLAQLFGMLEGSTGSRDTCGDTRSDAGRR
jgi:hypothetical protein